MTSSMPSAMASSNSGMALNTQGMVQHYAYSLEVVQQPDRARMCGFGDKDRRPITPPPCVRLVIVDTHTNREVDPTEVDAQHFVLSVDIWDSAAQSPANEVKHSNTSPSVSISMASVTSYPPPPEHVGVNPYYPQNMGRYGNQYGPGSNYGYGQHPPYTQTYATALPGTFQRNLIGSLSVSATLLEDCDSKASYWFVLQDLSVRTEGTFRLRFAFMNLAVPSPGCSSMPGLNQPMRVPILASTFTDTFQVYSAKRFPGVKESTELSKKFAQQGVKIPIRKDSGGTGKKRGSDDGSEND